MRRHALSLTIGGLLAVGLLTTLSESASAQDANRFYHYPFHYYPHNYWPNQERWPQPGRHFQRPPRWMAYPAYRDPGFRYPLGRPMRYYRGSHFWLDQF